ncbi:hypothetical protein ABN034_12735 [Actinopolymorpha sp. B11F2]|uniref:hypothetical protein n=1 Tax=Actinopolymorpha sp. B11F2 TaxID=3160862 RepID=UPI0032E43020
MAGLRPTYDVQGDVDRLVDLLCMLPVPRMDEPVIASYWTGIAATQMQVRSPGDQRSKDEIANDDAAYLTNRLGRAMLSVTRYALPQ